MPGWIPPWARDRLLNIAAKRATGWVDAEMKRVMAARERQSLGDRLHDRVAALARGKFR